ncbi:MAG: hypothetical protein RI601_09865 [Desulfurivibrionaceae bacterium]|nr:hypothetical protein [Desulfurivibrionaceae bacterium]
MQWPFANNTKRYALVGERSRTLLAIQNQNRAGVTTVTPWGWADCSLAEAKSVHQVMANVAAPKGTVALSLPLEQFEVLSLTINKVPREVVTKILPYHISKVFDEPLSLFIYDWQVVKELKDSLQLNVFLFPVAMFQDIRNTLNHYDLSPTSLEPDVFSACAYLESGSRLQADEASMIALLWPQSISIAIYDKETLVLTRNVQLERPLQVHGSEVPSAADLEKRTDDQGLQEPGSSSVPADSLFDSEQDDLLADFLIAKKKEEEGASPSAALGPDDQEFFTGLPEGPQARATGDTWPEYLSHVALELMRTRDYFNSVVKGNQVKTVFVGGAEDAWQPLSLELTNSLDINIKHLMEPERATFGDPLFEAVSIGVLS